MVKKVEIYLKRPKETIVVTKPDNLQLDVEYREKFLVVTEYNPGNFWGKGHIYRERIRIPLNRVIQVVTCY